MVSVVSQGGDKQSHLETWLMGNQQKSEQRTKKDGMRMSMELRHLRYFTVVTEELHFGHAAQRPHIEQSPLSRAIKELEEHLGVRLSDRTIRSVNRP